jgi:hypothetical protein
VGQVSLDLDFVRQLLLHLELRDHLFLDHLQRHHRLARLVPSLLPPPHSPPY